MVAVKSFPEEYQLITIFLPLQRRNAGVVERGGLENRCSPCVNRGFESPFLRQY